MRSTRTFLAFLVFLHACSTGPTPRESSPPAQPSRPPTADTAAPITEKPALGVSRFYRSAIPICFDAALRVCREREIVVRSQERGDTQFAKLHGEGRSLEFTLTFDGTASGRSRATLLLRGRSAREQLDQASRLLDAIGDALLEPRD